MKDLMWTAIGIAIAYGLMYGICCVMVRCYYPC